MAQGELLRIAIVSVAALGIAGLLFAFAHRMRRSAEQRVTRVIEALIANPRPYGDALTPLERPEFELGGDGLRVRFNWRQQRGLLSFAAAASNTRQLSAPRSFGGLEDDGSARTELRFFIQPTRIARIDPHATSIEGPWHADARRHIEALRRLGYQQGIGIATSPEGLFITKPGWLGISLDSGALEPWLDEACALVLLHLEGRLFEEEA